MKLKDTPIGDLTLDFLEKLAVSKMAPVHKIMAKLVDQTVEDPPSKMCTRKGLSRWDGTAWVEAEPDEMPRLVALDFEAIKKDITWYPECCSIWGLGNKFFYWNAHSGDLTMPFPRKRVVVGQNSTAYDRKYLSSEYDDKPANNVHIDTMQMATLMYGLGGGSGDTGDSESISLWKRFDAMNSDNKPTPKWYQVSTPVGLEALIWREFGIKMDKTIRDRWIKDPTSISPETLYEYCWSDTIQTARLAQKYWTRLDAFIPYKITHYGMMRINQTRVYLKDWDNFIAKSDDSYSGVVDKLYKLQDKLVTKSLDKKEELPDLDWKKYIRGKNKDNPHWIKKVQDSTTPLGSNIAAYLLQLTWEDKDVSLKKVSKGPKWFAGDTPLPHPTGKGNLGSPLCKDFLGFAKSGLLKSKVLPQSVLIKTFQLMNSISQWTSYQGRYKAIYRLPYKAEGDYISVADINGTGTRTRRSTGLWVVLPKPCEKIGSEVMGHIGTPKDMVLVSADYVSQESRIFTGMLTDARYERHCSNPWTEAVMTGDKSQKTDVHNLTASQIDISRHNAKTINFAIQYVAGLKTVSNSIRLIKGISGELAQKIASDFMGYLKGPQGIAKTSFVSLDYTTKCPDMRTYLLGVKIPNSLNAKYLPSSSSFKTVRSNWPIQSAGVDEKHLLIFILDTLISEHELDARFAYEIHDQVSYFSSKEHAPKVQELYDVAMEILINIAYQRAANFWDIYDPKAHKRKILKPLENWKKFEKVAITKTLKEVG